MSTGPPITLLGRHVAVKILHPQYAKDPVFIQRFRQEAQAAANLNQPNIVNVYDWGIEDGLYYIVMEYVEGRDLKDIILRGGPLLPERRRRDQRWPSAARWRRPTPTASYTGTSSPRT